MLSNTGGKYDFPSSICSVEGKVSQVTSYISKVGFGC